MANEPASKSAGKPIHLDDDSFDAAIASGPQPVLVDFHAAWCGPCRALAPTIDALATEYAGRAVIAKVDVDKAPGVASKLAVGSIPTIMIFKGGKSVDRIVGLVPKPTLAAKLDAAL